MEPIFISVAFIFGIAISLLRLPPLLGFLIAGFALNALGYESSELIQQLAQLGVMLLLFSIGLKLKVKSLLQKEVWASATIHISTSWAMYLVALGLLKMLGLVYLDQLDFDGLAIVAFALCFSSTVLAVKSLEQKSEMASLYGKIAIGILIMQDIFAVLFITASTGKLPSVWAFALFLLPLIRPLLYWVLDRVGHGELQILYGIFLALVMGGAGFELVGMKPDLGALIMGMLLASHPGANGMSKALFNMKELFLICFFLDIGLQGLPGLEHAMVAMLLCLLLVGKSALYYRVLMIFRLRARTGLLTASTLNNYSEFGLIVTSLSVSLGWLSSDWLLILALAVSFSFLWGSAFDSRVDDLYQKFRDRLKKHEQHPLNPKDRHMVLGSANVLVIGMGRIGTGAYDELSRQEGLKVVGLETDEDKVAQHMESGRNVMLGDAMDSDFWAKLKQDDQLQMVLLAMPTHHGNLYAVEQLQQRGYQGKIAAIAQFQDDIEQLRAMGISAVFNTYDEAGAGFARHVLEDQQQLQSGGS